MELPINEIVQGDCLEVMRGWPDGCVDSIVTDPPYCSGGMTPASMAHRGGMSRGETWVKKPLKNDTMTATGFIWFMRTVGAECLRLLRPQSSLLIFIDWRQYPVLFGALESCGCKIQTMIVWDKKNFALGNGFRNQHELIIHATNGTPKIYDRATGNVLRCARKGASAIHPTEKPVELMQRLVRVVTPPGGIVLDPFAGSGTTCVAAKQEGFDYIGIELSEEYCEIARRRVAHTEKSLFQ